MNDAHDIAQRLNRRIPDLVRDLLPAGRREGHEWRVGSLAGEKGRSLSVHLQGPRAGVWADFAAGESGDALSLVAAVLFGGEIGPALRWARQWLGIDTITGKPIMTRRPVPCEAEAPAASAEAEGRRNAARRLFLSAQPTLRDTPAAFYLAGRGIDLAELGRQPRSLRYHPELPNRESGRNWPALIAAITDVVGEHVGTHRTWLAQDSAGGWRKAPLRDQKMTLGSYAGGAIRLWRGSSGKPLAQATPGETVAIAEGIETALSIVLAKPELRVLCAVSLANMGRLVLPPAIGAVILCADNDGNNPAAARALQRAVDHFAADRRTVRIARPPEGFSDFNDFLQAGDV
jgi:hypothetical protein